MINLMVGLTDPSASSGSASLNKQSPPISSQSFESQLSEAVSEVLTKFGIDPGSIKLTVQDSPSENIATSQNSAAASTQLNTSTSSSPAPQIQTAPASVPAPQIQTPLAALSAQSADDAYWSKQPAAVQQLRNIQDQGQRTLLATQLASEGYSIDAPIMILGWDAGITTQLRQSYGYTWVPSALQQPVAEAPGIYDPGLKPYDPAHPPAGSIAV
jgi:hypothetical protein